MVSLAKFLAGSREKLHTRRFRIRIGIIRILKLVGLESTGGRIYQGHMIKFRVWVLRQVRPPEKFRNCCQVAVYAAKISGFPTIKSSPAEIASRKPSGTCRAINWNCFSFEPVGGNVCC